MSGHTPGPWKVEPINYDRDGGTLVRTDDRTCIANVWGVDDNLTPDDESVANARLIAAAPDLLDALRDALCALEVCGKDFDYAMSKAHAAITKATGEKS